MISIKTTEAKEQFSELINYVSQHQERIILTRRDQPIAAIVPIKDIALLTEKQHQQDLEEALEALKETRKQGAISLDDFKASAPR